MMRDAWRQVLKEKYTPEEYSKFEYEINMIIIEKRGRTLLPWISLQDIDIRYFDTEYPEVFED